MDLQAAFAQGFSLMIQRVFHRHVNLILLFLYQYPAGFDPQHQLPVGCVVGDHMSLIFLEDHMHLSRPLSGQFQQMIPEFDPAPAGSLVFIHFLLIEQLMTVVSLKILCRLHGLHRFAFLLLSGSMQTGQYKFYLSIHFLFIL